MALFKKKMSSLPQPTIGGVVYLDEKEIARIRADPRQRVYDFEYKDLKPSQKLTAEQALATARKVRARFEALPAGTDRRATLRGEFPDYAYSHEHIFNLITDPGAPADHWENLVYMAQMRQCVEDGEISEQDATQLVQEYLFKQCARPSE